RDQLETRSGNVNRLQVDGGGADIGNRESSRIFLTDNHGFEIDDGGRDGKGRGRILEGSGRRAARGQHGEGADANQQERLTVTRHGAARRWLRGRFMHEIQSSGHPSELATRSEYSFGAGVFTCTNGHLKSETPRPKNGIRK